MKKLGCLFLCLMSSQIFAMGKDRIHTPCAQRVVYLFSIAQPASTDSLNSLADCTDSPASKKNGRDLSDCPITTNTPSPRVDTKPKSRCVVSSPKKRASYKHGN